MFGEVTPKVKKFGALGLLVWAVSMIQIAEYGLAALLLIVACIGFWLQIHGWSGIPKRPSLTKAIRLTSVVGISLVFLFSGFVILKVKGSKPWSNVLMTNEHPGPKISTPDTPVSLIEVSDLFRAAHKEYVKELGDAIAERQSAGDTMLYAFEHGTVWWSLQLAGFYKLHHDEKLYWDFDPDPHFDSEPPWDSTEYVTNLPHLPKGQRPPYFGAASHWAKEPQKWEWLGGLEWLSATYASQPQQVFYQRCERGILIGPIRKSTTQNLADIGVLIYSDLTTQAGTWHSLGLTGFDELIPPYNPPIIRK